MHYKRTKIKGLVCNSYKENLSKREECFICDILVTHMFVP